MQHSSAHTTTAHPTTAPSSSADRRRGTRRLSGLGAALTGVALAGASMVMVAPAAQAASGSLAYTCNTGLLGEKTFKVVLDSNAPATILVGKTITPKVTAKVEVPVDVVNTLVGFVGASSVSGTAQAESVVANVAQTIAMSVPKTKVASGAPLEVVASGVAAPVTGARIGDVLTLAGGNFVTTLDFRKADGTSAIESEIPCVLNAGQNAKFDTVRVVDSSAIKATAAYKKAGKSVLATAKLTTGAGTPVSGKVQFVLKKGAKKVGSLNAVVTKGVARATFKKVAKKGAYQVIAVYGGSAKVQGARTVAKVTVR